jgi:hypothetical protein
VTTSTPSQSVQTTVETTTSTTKPLPATPRTSAAVHVVGAVNLAPGQPGKLSVIAVGGPTTDNSSSIPVVVRNNTSGTLYNVSATAIARRSGALVGSGDSQGFEPAVVHPGEWAYGYVYFSVESVVGATFEVTANADTEASSFGQEQDLKIAEVNKIPGEFGDSIVGIVTNTSNSTIGGTAEVWTVCFDGVTPTSVRSDFTDGSNPIAPGGTASFTVSLYTGECPSSYAIGAQGRTT